MSVLKEFKAFAMRGNVVDMAVGIIIGAAFGKIVSSFVGCATYDKTISPSPPRNGPRVDWLYSLAP